MPGECFYSLRDVNYQSVQTSVGYPYLLGEDRARIPRVPSIYLEFLERCIPLYLG